MATRFARAVHYGAGAVPAYYILLIFEHIHFGKTASTLNSIEFPQSLKVKKYAVYSNVEKCVARQFASNFKILRKTSNIGITWISFHRAHVGLMS